jgi:hypothetical protein
MTRVRERGKREGDVSMKSEEERERTKRGRIGEREGKERGV